MPNTSHSTYEHANSREVGRSRQEESRLLDLAGLRLEARLVKEEPVLQEPVLEELGGVEEVGLRLRRLQRIRYKNKWLVKCLQHVQILPLCRLQVRRVSARRGRRRRRAASPTSPPMMMTTPTRRTCLGRATKAAAAAAAAAAVPMMIL